MSMTYPSLDSSVDFTCAIFAEKKWLGLPVKKGALMRPLELRHLDVVVRWCDVELSTGKPDWIAWLDISEWRGGNLEIRLGPPKIDPAATAVPAPEAISADTFVQSDEGLPTAGIYSEAQRAQFHFSAKRGWLNDPNGLVYYDGEYHLFFQHNPYGVLWGNMHWGHAVSADLVHWRELDIALYPDRFGVMFSGSAVVDWNNTSGLGRDGKPPIALLYTAAGEWVQCLATSTDGRTFEKFPHGVVPNFGEGNRDPKVIWHEPTKKWVMTLFKGDGPNGLQRGIFFFTSSNLKEWVLVSACQVPDTDRNGYFYECPDFFELPVDGDPSRKMWVLTAANSSYALGQFDGTTFTAEVSRLNGQRGRGFFASQTISDDPHGRCVEIGWIATDTSAAMPFNQSMSVPMELKLKTTPEGVRLTRTPVKELTALRVKTHLFEAFHLEAGAENPLAKIDAELLEIRVAFHPGTAREVALKVRGVSVAYDASTQELTVGDLRVSALLHAAQQNLIIYVDRTGLEVFAGKGEVYVPFPINLDPLKTKLELAASDGLAHFAGIEVHELKSIWHSSGSA